MSSPDAIDLETVQFFVAHGCSAPWAGLHGGRRNAPDRSRGRSGA